MAKTLSRLFKEMVDENPDLHVILSKDENGVFQPTTWKELYAQAKRLAAGLISVGVKRGNHVGIISDNRKEWLQSDFAILGIGAADVPRGSDSMAGEIKYILHHADCAVTLVENETQLGKVLSICGDAPRLATLIVLDPAYSTPEEKRGGVTVLSLEETKKRGDAYLQNEPDCYEKAIDQVDPEDLATIIYTSGTTGEPKGVMLTHSSYMHQVRAPHTPIDVGKGDVFLSVLPIWHSYERALEYFAFFAGATIAYSKPISQVIGEDLVKANPSIFPSIPRIWEGTKARAMRTVRAGSPVKKAMFYTFLAVGTWYSKVRVLFRGLKPQFRKRSRLLDMLVSFLPLLLLTPLNLLGQVLVFSKVKKRLGTRFRFGVSGGGALPPHVDDFFAAAGVLLLEGYGLTETAPIVSVRDCRRPVPGTIGPPLPEVQVKVVDENGDSLPPGQKGVLYIRGPNIMKGYYKKPEETSKTIDKDGWLNSGDLAMMTHKGEIKIVGRVKETIVLLGGENVEPTPIEETIKESEYIDQVMVVGQDQRYLAALVVPMRDALEEYAKQYSIPYQEYEDLLENEEVCTIIMNDINSLISPKRGFKLFERINRVHFLAEPFEIGVEMTHTLKLKRDVINERYKKEIASLFPTR